MYIPFVTWLINIGFQEKAFFCLKLSKVAKNCPKSLKNCDHNIGPRSVVQNRIRAHEKLLEAVDLHLNKEDSVSAQGSI
jgi:hypothetical protein